MVCTWLPQGVAALHAAPADQSIHDGVVEAVTHVQAAGDVRRRDHDGVGLAGTLRGEIVVRFPGLVPGSLDGVRLVGLVHAAGPLKRLVGNTGKYKGKRPRDFADVLINCALSWTHERGGGVRTRTSLRLSRRRWSSEERR